MTAWRCLVLTASGSAEWRSFNAADRETILLRLKADGLTALDLREGNIGLIERLQQPVSFGTKLTIAEQALFLRQLATLVVAGVPLDRALDLLRDQSRRAAQRKLIDDILRRVRSGGSLAAALDDAAAFPAFVTGTIRAAERGGRLGAALTSLGDRLELAASTRRQLVTALSYPAAVLFATIAALFLVLTVIVPRFEPMFEGQEDRLPSLTRAVLGLSRLVSGYGVLLLIAAVLMVVGGVAALRVPHYRASIAQAIAPLPPMQLRDQHLTAQFSSLLGTLLLNGLTVTDALPLVRSTFPSERWRRHLTRVESDVRAGRRLSAALGREKLVSGTVIRLIEVGEQSGGLGQTCLQAGKILSETVRARVDRIVSLANPIAIIMLGGLVGALVASVMLGIFAIGDLAG